MRPDLKLLLLLQQGGVVALSTANLSIPAFSLLLLVFAAIHPQGLVAIPALAAIAVGLGLMREWRGSLIAPMVMHACSNGIVVTLMVLVAR